MLFKKYSGPSLIPKIRKMMNYVVGIRYFFDIEKIKQTPLLSQMVI
ncbi:MAG: hypothetical protein LBT10_05820 [Methanobrevibacter sp.]|jgi:hypothetical protein|nr:hypothetical protein [Methanobrevibacter sp.]